MTAVGKDSGAAPHPAIDAITWQAEYCWRNDAPITARVVTALLAVLRSPTLCGQRMRDWRDVSRNDAMPLRIAGGFHNLHLTGADARLAPVYAGDMTDQGVVDATVLAVLADHDAALVGWFDGPPQTNEAGRSAGIMAGLLWLAEQVPPRFSLFEIGASAGINTMMNRFAFDLGGVHAGADVSPMRIMPQWRGPPPPSGPVTISSIRGCDLEPIDLADPAAALRLKSYVWADAPVRMERIDAAVMLARQDRPLVEQADAADGVERWLASTPPEAGTTRALFHSIVWQYLPAAAQARIEQAMEKAGADATAGSPLAWVQLETNRETYRHELRVRSWPGADVPDGEWVVLGTAHAHGAWIEWFRDPLHAE